MKNFLHEFRTFAMRGNVVDLAIAVVIGAAFGKIVTSLVDTLITPFIGLLIGGLDFSGLVFTFRSATFAYGLFLQSVIDFVIIAFVIFLAIRVMNRFKREETVEPEKKPSEEVVLLTEIRDALKK